MKIIGKSEINTENINYAISAVVFGLFMFGLVGYFLYISDENCLRYTSRSGFHEYCGENRSDGIPPIAIMFSMGLLFFITGICQIYFKRKGKR